MPFSYAENPLHYGATARSLTRRILENANPNQLHTTPYSSFGYEGARHRRNRPARGCNRRAAGTGNGDPAAAGGGRGLVRAATERLGGLDLLVNAASEGFVARPLEGVDEAAWDAALGATAKGTFFVPQAAAPLLRESGGVVVMIEDIAAYQPWPSFAPHCAAKEATRWRSRALRVGP